MSFGALAAVGACVQIVKTLYEYHNVHTRNKALLDILESFSQNLEISIERLQAREQMLGFAQNDALDSIERDFRKAKEWLQANDKNLRSIWTALQASDKLKDLDDRLCKAFASKMSVAIFSALQDTRAGVARIETTLEGLPTNLETVCRTSTKEAIHEVIDELKAEAYAVGSGAADGKGFSNGEAEKIISQLVDQLAEQERLKEDEELLLMSTYPILDPAPPHAATVPYAPVSAPSQYSADQDAPFEPSASRPSSTFSRRRSQMTLGSTAMISEAISPPVEDPTGLMFDLVDLTGAEIVDPVLASDGLIYDRWALVNAKIVPAKSPLRILGEVTELRDKLFAAFPNRKQLYRSMRQEYRLNTLRLYKSSTFTDLPVLLDRFSHILLFEPSSVSLHVRRGLVNYRLRLLDDALRDLDLAVHLSKRGLSGETDKHKPDVDALRARALVLEELHRNKDALQDIEAVLAQVPRDVLSLSLRATIRGNDGDATNALADLAATNAAVRAGKAYRSRLGDDDTDLEYLARGWAYCSVRDFASAATDFGYSASLRDPADPYAAACQALALIKQEESKLGSASATTLETCLAQLEASLGVIRTAIMPSSTPPEAEVPRTLPSGAPALSAVEAGFPVTAYPTLLLRGSAKAVQGDAEQALTDIELALRLRPSSVREVSSLRCAMAELRLAGGDREGAQHEYDLALAAAAGVGGTRAAVLSAREQHGV
ncbi:hypothetical protein RHOSPDRAFT_25581 [Rhodotorula sp. JG-1b]|nr:hypothetical protein RHOSPDRAFT_25581 [Rhodotorula sp. JG-1b]